MEDKDKEVKKEEIKKFEIDALAIISILVMALSIGFAIYSLKASKENTKGGTFLLSDTSLLISLKLICSSIKIFTSKYP